MVGRMYRQLQWLWGKLPLPGSTLAHQWSALQEADERFQRGDLEGAVAPYAEAIGKGRAPAEVLDRARWGLARAAAATGRADVAARALNDLLPSMGDTDPRMTEALQLSGDLALELEDVEIAEERFTAAQERARFGSEDWVAAQQGLATCTAVRAQPRKALRQLGEALKTMGRGTHPAVIAPVLADAVLLELVLGRWGPAREHAQVLIDWTPDLREPRALGHALLGRLHVAVAAWGDSLACAMEAMRLVGKVGPSAGEAGLQTARLLCEMDRDRDALAVLDTLAPVRSALYDPAGQILALRARATAPTDKARARALANQAMDRVGPLHPLAAWALRLDAARALIAAGNPGPARVAAQKALEVVPRADPKGARLEALLALHETTPDDREIHQALGRTGARLMAELPRDAAATFRNRDLMPAALASIGVVDPDPITGPLPVPPAQR